MNSNGKNGAILAVMAYSMWGLAPVFFKLLDHISPLEILLHRILWSVVVLAIIISVKNNWRAVIAVFKDKKNILLLMLSSCFLALNWWLFIWAINSGRILDASLGYYINPILNVALGMVFLSERLSRLQYLALALAFTGVLIQVVTYGSFPIVAFGLASSFAMYGLIRKTIKVDAVTGIFWESALLIVPAIIYWLVSEPTVTTNMFNNPLNLNLLFIATGLVTTAPLLCFVGAARRLNYSTMGFFQYIGPSIMFLFAIFVYQENMSDAKWQTFAFIWTALIFYSYSSYRTYSNNRIKTH